MEGIPETERFPRGEIVALKDGRVGREFRYSYQAFPLRHLVSEGAKYLGADKFSEVYFRTRKQTPKGVVYSLYRLDHQGELIDADESRRKGRIVSRQFSRAELGKAVITVGDWFEVPGRGFQSTEVHEIVAATDKQYVPEYLKTLTRGKTSRIIEDFENGLPPDFEVQ